MRFIYYFYIILIYFCERAWIIRGSTDLSIAELRHLSEKLHPEQCNKLLESLYLRTPGYTFKEEKKSNQLPSSEECQLKLEQWNHTFPGKKNKRARVHIIKILQTIGRVDLANYVKRSKRIAELLHNIKYLPRRYRKHLEELKKKRNKAKKLKFNLKKKSNKLFNKPRAVSALVERQAKEEDGHSTRWIVIIICFLLLVGAIIATAAIAIYKSRSKTRQVMLNNVPGCYPHCKGYERLPRDLEDGWMSSMSDLPRGKWKKSSSVPDLSLTESSEPERKPEKKPEKKTEKKVEKKVEKKTEKKVEKKPEKKKKQKRKSSDKLLQKTQEVTQVEKIITTETKIMEKDNKVKRESKEKKEIRKSLPESVEVTDFEDTRLIDGQEVINIMDKHNSTCGCCHCRAKPDGTTDERHLCQDEQCKYYNTDRILKKCFARLSIKNGRKSSFLKNKGRKNSKLTNDKKLSEDKKILLSSSASSSKEESNIESPPTTKRRSKSKSPPPPVPKEQKRESKAKEKSPKKEKTPRKEKSPRKSSSPKNIPKSSPKTPKHSPSESCVKGFCSRNSSPKNNKN